MNTSNFYDNDDLLWDSEIEQADMSRDKQKSKRNKHNRKQLSDQKRQQFDQDSHAQQWL
ncbi:hypothetical protein [Shewanella sp. UCD-KL12]|uniref:hypothetical protein n=1 Tax=Shewanella sp. UCD-KL12 TaxID=1917163 RepID=UPI0015C34807|nr:hypothetical protein [Shewanella sp. UCD-KL12]